MDTILATKAATVAVGLLVGRWMKKNPAIDQKSLGLPAHLALGQTAVAATVALAGTFGVPIAPLTPQDGLEITIGIEIAHQAGKTVYHAGRQVVRGARALGRLVGRIF